MNTRIAKSMRLTLLTGLVLFSGTGVTRVPSEYELKAAFLYKFGRYVEWPTSSFVDTDSPLVIGVLGKDPYGSYLDEIVQVARVQGRRVEAIRIKDPSEVNACHILFISSSEERHVSNTLAQLAGQSVLTVGESEWFARDGGMIRFETVDESLRLEINLHAVQDAGLEISSRLLKLARISSYDRDEER